jgi:hypothetical protein
MNHKIQKTKMEFRLQGMCIASLLGTLPSHQIASLFLEIDLEINKRLEFFKMELIRKFKKEFCNKFELITIDFYKNRSLKIMFSFGIDQLITLYTYDPLNLEIYYSNTLASLQNVLHYDELLDWLKKYPGFSPKISKKIYEFVLNTRNDFEKNYAVLLLLNKK